MAKEEATEPVQVEYYGTDEKYRYVFPDGVTYVECKVMVEGDRQKYQGSVNRDVRIARQSGDMHLKLSTGEERNALLGAAIVGWNLIRDGKPVTFSKGTPGAELEKWIAQAPTHLIDAIEKEIRDHESWLLGDMTVEDIDEQIENLMETRAKLVKEAEGKGN